MFFFYQKHGTKKDTKSRNPGNTPSYREATEAIVIRWRHKTWQPIEETVKEAHRLGC